MRIRLICLPESTSDLILEGDRRWCEMEGNKSIVAEYISAQTSLVIAKEGPVWARYVIASEHEFDTNRSAS